MTAFEILALLLTTAAAFAYINHRWIRLQPAIGLMALALAASTALIVVDQLGIIQIAGTAERILTSIDFDDTLLHGLLGVLLFAGALHINLEDLADHKLAVATLALVGTLISSFVVAGLMYAALGLLGLNLRFGYCLLFGTLISPTDPIAVMGILKSVGVPRSLEVKISGESMFNDGVGVVMFLTVLGIVAGGESVTVGQVALLFVREAIGGAVFGLITGYLAYRLLRSIDHYQTELLVTLALVLGGYTVAEWLHLSAPIAAVTAGLLIGNHGRTFGMSDSTRDHLDKFWLLIDEILNALLFVIVGFELIRVSLVHSAVLAGVIAIPVVLLSRLASVAIPVGALSRTVSFSRGAIWILTWGGLRGGISIALALSTPPGPAHDLLVTMTYVVVVFSILIQGLTLGKVAARFAANR